MTDTKNPAPNHTTLHDVIGLALIVASALLGVSAYMFIKNGAPENPWAFTAMMSALVTTFGPPAILWMCFGCGYIGARLFLFGSERSPVRDPLGFTFTALGLAILAGALRPNAGGSFGVMIAGVLPTILGVLLGFALLITSVWAFWLRVAPPALIAKANALLGEAPGSETTATAPSTRIQRPAPSPKKVTEDPSGVTTAEADALLPSPEREEILAALRTANRNSATTVNHAPSPYPADVRREGGIPAGARPIESAHEQRPVTPLADSTAASIQPKSATPVPAPGGGSASGAGPLRTWSPAKSVAGQVGAGADLAQGKDARGAGTPARASNTPELKAPAIEATSKAKPASPVEPPPIGASAPTARAIPILTPSAVGPIGTPTWETDEDEADQDDEVEVAEIAEPKDELVVDAYGTPLELVAELRGRGLKASLPIEDEDELEEAEVVETWGKDPDALLDEAVEDDLEEESELEDADDFGEDDVEFVPAALASALLVEEPESDDAELEPQPEDIEAEPAVELPASAVDPLPSAEPAEHAEREVVLQPVQNSLFDAPLPTPVAPAPAAVTPKSAPKERRVVLDPQAAPSARSEPTPTGDDLVFKCGLLFLKQNRVAVSMLQREFGLDFKQATAVLDQLQEQGLIGPYLGGQRRDILLTAEEWRARVGAAS